MENRKANNRLKPEYAILALPMAVWGSWLLWGGLAYAVIGGCLAMGVVYVGLRCIYVRGQDPDRQIANYLCLTFLSLFLWVFTFTALDYSPGSQARARAKERSELPTILRHLGNTDPRIQASALRRIEGRDTYWLSKLRREYPNFEEAIAAVAADADSDTVLRVRAVEILDGMGSSRVAVLKKRLSSDTYIIGALVRKTAERIGTNGDWIHGQPDANTEAYIALNAEWLAESVTSALAREVSDPNRRMQTLFLAVKLGIPGSERDIVAVLDQHGDKQMAEDFLNCGSPTLADSGRSWAEQHGYSISSGSGSNRVQWGRL
jgi:hypothetical protein